MSSAPPAAVAKPVTIDITGPPEPTEPPPPAPAAATAAPDVLVLDHQFTEFTEPEGITEDGDLDGWDKVSQAGRKRKPAAAFQPLPTDKGLRVQRAKQVEAAPAAAPQGGELTVGLSVMAKFAGDGRHYAAIIAEALPGGSFLVNWCDGDADHRAVSAADIRRV